MFWVYLEHDFFPWPCKFKQNQMVICIPVSYTHLDVYKRQLVLLKHKMLLVNYPSNLTDLHQNQQSLSPLQYAKNYLNLRQLSFAVENILHTDTDVHTHTDTFRKTTFLHVLRVVQSESALSSNTIFFPSPYFHSLGNMEVKYRYGEPYMTSIF